VRMNAPEHDRTPIGRRGVLHIKRLLGRINSIVGGVSTVPAVLPPAGHVTMARVIPSQNLGEIGTGDVRGRKRYPTPFRPPVWDGWLPITELNENNRPV